ncbi:MAG: MBL fold metallo-hydrolase [Blastocatellia bacterium]|jgi:phosphoribosyl 1,2-cyclic phosphodiesterase
MRFCTLGSGSAGNATLIVAGETRVLLDCGLSGRETLKRLQAVGEDPSRLNAVVLTHEHGDHVRGLAALAKSLGIEVYASTATLAACNLGEKERFIRRGEALKAGQSFEIGELVFHPFAIPHDAADPLAFTIESAGCRMGMAVDLGYFSREAVEGFRGCDALILEANHEIEMLKVCTYYPWALKQRIMGRHGHTSNTEMARFLREDFDGRATYIVLAHLSQNTNLPLLAKQAAVQALEERAPLFAARAGERVSVAPYDRPGSWVQL